MTTVFLALGTNLGERLDNLRAAVRGLGAHVRVSALSPVYETAPMYVLDQPRYLNMALCGETGMAAPELLAFVKELEEDIGRVPGLRFGPRLIDIDILFLGQAVVSLPELEIPHPRLVERAFVLRPLADIAPDWRHPVLGRTMIELLAVLPAEDGLEICRQGV